MGSAEGRAKFLQDARPLVKRIGAPMLGLMLRKRVAELAGITQTELEQRFELAAPRRGPQAPGRTTRPSGDPYSKLLERVLAEPTLVSELGALDLSAASLSSLEAHALADLIEQARALPGDLRVADAMELLR